ncbi:hypothetical protein [Ramlibacter montanisoli]|uniref:Uncharacterized protein n=1 Tax=Ramlibacter montanisoli TaxID=2732512 RepID=A0A849K5Q1_9BURK|nr:hypothetical protein [Ramlibacter montanisoli]NNU43718.1 hypothetical protein [Ramlibacter montanisoli]
MDTTAGTDTLIVYDGSANAGVSQTAVVLGGVTPDQLGLMAGNNWIQHI